MGAWVDGQWKGTGWPQTVCPPAKPEAVMMTVSTVPRPPPVLSKRERVVEDIRRHGSRLNRAPVRDEDNALAKRADKAFGSWADAVEASGYPRPTRPTKHTRRPA